MKKLLFILFLPFFLNAQFPAKFQNFLNKPFPKNSSYTVENTFDVYGYGLLSFGVSRVINIAATDHKVIKRISGGFVFGVNSAVVFERGTEGKMNGSWGALCYAQADIMVTAYKETKKEKQLKKKNRYSFNN